MAAPIIKSTLDTTYPMSFAKTRHGYLIGVNGINRGIMWDGRSSSAGELGIDPPSTPPTITTPKVEKQATATITLSTDNLADYAPSNDIDPEALGGAAPDGYSSITIKDGFGKTVEYIFRRHTATGSKWNGTFKETYAETHVNYPGGRVYVDIDGLGSTVRNNVASYLGNVIRGPNGHNGSITVSRAGGVLTLTQTQGGSDGNNTITVVDKAGSSSVAASGFTGGFTTGRSAYTEITVVTDSPADLNNDTLTLIANNLDGTTTSVEYDWDSGTSPDDTGPTIKINGLTSAATIAAKLELAIEHSGGHNGKLIVSRTSNKLIVYQNVAGPEGNTSVTETTANTAHLTASNFTGGTNVSGATGGDYTCFYRYVDQREGVRFYSNLSPYWVAGADAYDNFSWSNLSASSQAFKSEDNTGRVTHVQLLRTTFNQATTAYVVATLPQRGKFSGATDTGTAVFESLKGHGLVKGMRINVTGAAAARSEYNALWEVASVANNSSSPTTKDDITMTTGNTVAAETNTMTWELEGYTEDSITDGQMVLFRGDYRQKLLQTDGRPAANRHAIPPFFKSVCCAFQDRMTYLVDPTYSTGTIAATVNTTTIKGTSTAWTSDLEGRLICPNPEEDTNTYTIVSVNASADPQEITVDRAVPAIASSTTYTIINPPEERNTIYISEQDLPESVITQIAIQENVRDEDELVGAIVMGAQYYALKEHSIYRVTWAKNPLLDAQPQLAAMRGAINNRCADQHEGVLYLMDEEGPYALTGNTVNPIGVAVADQWSDSVLDFSKKSTWFVRVDALEELVYYFVTRSGESRPQTALVYDIRTSMWSKWTYSWEVGDCVKLTYGSQRRLLMASKNDNFYVMNDGLQDGGANISYSWKSGMFSWVESDQSTTRYFRVTFQPTTNAATMDIKKYDNHSTSAVSMNEWDGGDGVTIEQGADKAVADLKLSQHADGDEPGSKVLPWTGKLPLLRGRPVRWVSCEISGQQSSDRIIVYEIEIGGVK